MSTDWKALCKELVDALHEHTSLYEGHECELVTRARAALALGIDQPLHATMKELVVHFAGELLAIDAIHHGIRAHEVARLWFGDPVLMTNPIIERACMAFIEDYGDALAQPEPEHPTPRPIPVSERLPGAGDCDANGRCWHYCVAGDGVGDWITRKPTSMTLCKHYRLTHWLPAHTLPLPQEPAV